MLKSVMKVTIFFGSASDAPAMKKAAELLKSFDVEYDAFVISAHRAGELLAEKVREAESTGTEVFIAGAGLSAALPGVVASLTVLPVIGVPLDCGKVAGLDSLLSVVQMPKQVPVAAVGLDNAENAAFLAVEILAVKYPELRARLLSFRKEMQDKMRDELDPRVLDS